MRLLSTLERKFGKYIPENITVILLVGQVISYVFVYAQPILAQYFYLSGERLLQGEVWRLITFVFGPVSESLIFVIFAWYFFYILGTALENQWGSFRYVAYLLLAYSGTVIFAFLFPGYPIFNTYMYTSLFLAFAHVYPNFQLLLFFILPIKVKWLGYLAWLGLFASFLFGSLPLKILILFSVGNFFIFFWQDLLFTFKVIGKGLFGGSKDVLAKGKPRHVCAVCGKNELENPNMEIRYCKQCFPETCYCGEHIKDHQHKRAVN